MDSATAGKIKDAVDAGFDEQVDFTAELVKFPSRRGREHTAQDFMALAMRDQGLAVDRWQIDVKQLMHLPGFSPVYVDYDNAFNVGKMQGGDWASSVPSWCVFDLRVAVYPGDDLNSRRAELEACIRDAASQDAFLRNAPPQVKYNGFLAEGYVLKDADEAENALGWGHQEAYGQELRAEVTTATTDAAFLAYMQIRLD